jgi:hypothetical protein
LSDTVRSADRRRDGSHFREGFAGVPADRLGHTVANPEKSAGRQSRPVGIGLTTVFLLVATAIARDPADDEFDENAALLEQEFAIGDPIVYQRVFGIDAIGARRQLDSLLRKKIASVDLICRLTDAQKQKLLLAGGADNKRLLERVEKIETQFQHVKNDSDKIKELVQEIELLKRGLNNPRLSNDGSLFVKVLPKTLTAEQLARYAPLRAVFQVGGQFQKMRQGRDSVLHVGVANTAFADEDLAHLNGLTSLQSLDLSGTQVTDAGLIHLKEFAELKELYIGNTQVTDASLVHMEGLTSLQFLALSGTKVTGTGLVHLRGLASLQGLILNDTLVTDAGLENVKVVESLQQVNLSGTQVTDEGLVHLKGLTKLWRLSFDGTHVTDAGLAHLKDLQNLRLLDLHGTTVTVAGIAHLKLALPKVRIEK